MARALGVSCGDTNDETVPATLRADFIANVAHELKTPVGAVALLAEAMTLEKDPDVVRRLADRILDESERLGRLIDDLIGFSDVQIAEPIETVSVREIVVEALARIRLAAHAKDVRIDVAAAEDGAVVHGRRRELVSALVNLLENSVKYSFEHGRVAIEILRRESGVEVAIADEGMGIPATELDHVLERGFRGQNARALPGYGLGLAIVRRVAQAHGGQVLVTSKVGNGSVFTLQLPATRSVVELPEATGADV